MNWYHTDLICYVSKMHHHIEIYSLCLAADGARHQLHNSHLSTETQHEQLQAITSLLQMDNTGPPHQSRWLDLNNVN